jgi:surfactin synthase thioesterase subunit
VPAAAATGEPFPDSVDEVVTRLADAVEDRIRAPWLLFGHSMGDLLAWEVAVTLARRGGARRAVRVRDSGAAPRRRAGCVRLRRRGPRRAAEGGARRAA